MQVATLTIRRHVARFWISTFGRSAGEPAGRARCLATLRPSPTPPLWSAGRSGRLTGTPVRFLVLAQLAMVAVASVQAQTPPPERTPVFVTSIGAARGFTDPSKDNTDTVKDLQESIRDQKLLVLVDHAEEAVIVLTVIGRETAGVTAGFMGNAARDRIIRVKFKSGELETDLTAAAQGGTIGSGGSWGKAAKKIGKQVNDWVKDNRGKAVNRLSTGQ